MKRPTKFLIAILVCGLLLQGTVFFVTAQAGTEVSGNLKANTTWTKANSPYTLIGPLAVDKAVTLVVEAGVTVNLNQFYIQVNGTLIARGNDNDKIYFNGGSIFLRHPAMDGMS